MSASFSTVNFFAPFYPKTAKHRFIAMMRAYFDDSGTHASSTMVACGGVIVSDKQHDLLKPDWERLLSLRGLPFFHFTKFKAHKVPPYCNMSEGEREILLYQLLLAIRVRIRFCFAGIMPVSVYENTLTTKEKERYGNAYAWALQLTWRLLRSWAERNHYTDPIPFVVEAGTSGSEQIGDVFNQVFADPVSREHFRLHSLVEDGKTDFIALQAADIVANSFFEVNSRLVKDGEKIRRIGWISKEVRLVDEMLKVMPVRSMVYDSEWLRSEADKINEHYVAVGRIAAS